MYVRKDPEIWNGVVKYIFKKCCDIKIVIININELNLRENII